MRVAYRRMSGAIGVSPKEQGTRGLWYEKRKALVELLWQRGHQVEFVSRMTKESQFVPVHQLNNQDILLVEFGSSNMSFYGNDLKDTIKMVNDFCGPVVFLNDDPDLPFIWDMVNKPKQWTCWYNATNAKPLGKQPKDVKIYDMPFSSLQKAEEPREQYQKFYLVYIGRPNGRSRAVKQLIAGGVPWRVFGKQKEWEDFGVMVQEPPHQPERAGFYSCQLGCLVLADNKHKEMGWRTGRAYHAINAGCPALIEADHKLLQGFPTFNSPLEVHKYFHRRS